MKRLLCMCMLLAASVFPAYAGQAVDVPEFYLDIALPVHVGVLGNYVLEPEASTYGLMLQDLTVDQLDFNRKEAERSKGSIYQVRVTRADGRREVINAWVSCSLPNDDVMYDEFGAIPREIKSGLFITPLIKIDPSVQKIEYMINGKVLFTQVRPAKKATIAAFSAKRASQGGAQGIMVSWRVDSPDGSRWSGAVNTPNKDTGGQSGLIAGLSSTRGEENDHFLELGSFTDKIAEITFEVTDLFTAQKWTEEL